MTSDALPRSGWRSAKFLGVLGLLLLLVGAAASWLASTRQGQDYSTLHVTALALVQASPLYETDWQQSVFPACCRLPAPWGMFYPPSTGLAVLPLGLLPYSLAEPLFLLLIVAAVVVGVRTLVRTVAPDSPTHVWTISSGAILLSACMRWGMTPLQGAPLVTGLLCLMLAAMIKDQAVLAFALATFAISFKLTLALPFLGLLFLYRRYFLLAATGVTWVLLNALGFVRLGGSSAFQGYLRNVRMVETLDNVNTPDAWSAISVPRTDWAYFFHGIGVPVELARIVALCLSALVALWLLAQSLRISKKPTLDLTIAFLTPAICLSLLCVYHHHYDIALIVVPVVAALGLRSPGRFTPALWLLLPLLAVAALAPVASLLRWIVTLFGPQARGLITLMFPAVITLALVGSLAHLWRATAGPLPAGRKPNS
jgi:hypothetical protein